MRHRLSAAATSRPAAANTSTDGAAAASDGRRSIPVEEGEDSSSHYGMAPRPDSSDLSTGEENRAARRTLMGLGQRTAREGGLEEGR